MPTFTKDFTTPHAATWQDLLAPFVGAPDVLGVEIGCLEGRTSLWFAQHILTHMSARLLCIDPWCSPLFFENVAPVRHKVLLFQQPSQTALRDRWLTPESVSFVYIDGNHDAPHVLEDAVLAFPLLRAGGIMIFDDYRWKGADPEDPTQSPQLAIDAFLSVYDGQYTLRHRGWQIAVEKLPRA